MLSSADRCRSGTWPKAHAAELAAQSQAPAGACAGLSECSELSQCSVLSSAYGGDSVLMSTTCIPMSMNSNPPGTWRRLVKPSKKGYRFIPMVAVLQYMWSGPLGSSHLLILSDPLGSSSCIATRRWSAHSTCNEPTLHSEFGGECWVWCMRLTPPCPVGHASLLRRRHGVDPGSRVPTPPLFLFCCAALAWAGSRLATCTLIHIQAVLD